MYNSTLGYLENAKGEYLMLHRVKKKRDINQGKWIGVGGKFEDGEAPEECFCREVLEERRERLIEVAEYLLVHETMSGEEFAGLMGEPKAVLE